ncbi:hypothetical protein ACOSP7_013174 [Xanthoceras sorbifolium]
MRESRVAGVGGEPWHVSPVNVHGNTAQPVVNGHQNSASTVVHGTIAQPVVDGHENIASTVVYETTA